MSIIWQTFQTGGVITRVISSMTGLDPVIHVFQPAPKKGVDGRDMPGHGDRSRP
jgi:hypothetical protein